MSARYEQNCSEGYLDSPQTTELIFAATPVETGT